MRKAVFLLVILLPAMFSGCFGEDSEVSITVSDIDYPEPWERSNLEYLDTDVFSRVTVNGSHGIEDRKSVV